MIIRKDFFGGAESIGVFLAVTEKYLLYPPIIKKASVEEITKAFSVPAISTTLPTPRAAASVSLIDSWKSNPPARKTYPWI